MGDDMNSVLEAEVSECPLCLASLRLPSVSPLTHSLTHLFF